jgi:hypothetical protein
MQHGASGLGTALTQAEEEEEEEDVNVEAEEECVERGSDARRRVHQAALAERPPIRSADCTRNCGGMCLPAEHGGRCASDHHESGGIIFLNY